MAEKPQRPEGINENQAFRFKEVDRRGLKHIKQNLNDFLIEGEEVEACYKGIRDYIVFTNKRMISVDVQGYSGMKKKFTFIPYNKIQEFCVNTAGLVDLDVSVHFTVGGLGPVQFDFPSTTDAKKLVQLVSLHTLKK